MFGGDAGRVEGQQVREESEGAFRLARRSALGRLRERLRRWFSGVELCCEGCCEYLLCFEEEAEPGAAGGGPGTGTYDPGQKRRAFETVEVSKIVDGVGRCRSFDAAFRPVCFCSAERWRSVDRSVREGRPLSPVELYELGGRYFIVDGNHRVSVARHRGMAAVEALVTELPAP